MTTQTHTKITETITNKADHVSPAKMARKVVFSAITVGKEDSEGACIHEAREISDALDVLQKSGHDEVDTARAYGASDDFFGQVNWLKKGTIMNTKLNPRRIGPSSYSHKPEDLKRGPEDSLKALQTDHVDCWYLHTPDVCRDPGQYPAMFWRFVN
ncbi:aflatoxin b1-aldehyde reductase [Metarhizium robertsii ARSEF 23]|uniref:Aflatoxin b1-aldehyde reductase n=1 Tax=Metarhizium robertsii (strain ARSEF 23 / ATCC MYA-3075) TaxID=655844 RepID=E9F7N5_METRA|nr:aflatoxin b1-aldehyde reductase [Metarhizium robertsii ARSEF 23]EFY96173.1 aflatoxin b1-aldehyde reductase [Metarhizium robertsii ARSEF 23]